MQNFATTRDVTLFVPNNEAFTALGPAISNMTTAQLGNVLDYMVLPELLYSTGFVNGSKFTTLQGNKLTISRSGNNVFVNSAKLLVSDILIANGVIHVIDNVLNPQEANIQPNPDLPTQVVAFPSASRVNDLPFTSGIPCTASCSVSSVSSGTTSAPTSVRPQSTSNPVTTGTSKAQAVAMARETGFKAAGLMVALGGVALII